LLVVANIECCRADATVGFRYIDPIVSDRGGSLGGRKRDGSLLGFFRRTAYILFFTGSDRAAGPSNPDSDRMSVDLVYRRQHGSKPFNLVTTDSDDSVSLGVCESKPEQTRVESGTSGVTDEVLGGEPKRPLERSAIEFGFGPKLDPDREISPSRSEMLRKMFHAFVSPIASRKASATSVAVTGSVGLLVSFVGVDPNTGLDDGV
jgi:hypothetical protein